MHNSQPCPSINVEIKYIALKRHFCKTGKFSAVTVIVSFSPPLYHWAVSSYSFLSVLLRLVM